MAKLRNFALTTLLTIYKANIEMFSIEKFIPFNYCDPAGIMFFAKAFEIAHLAYEKFLRENNLGYYFSGAETLLPIIHTEADYIKPLKAGDMVKILLNLAEVKENSFSLFYEIYNPLNELSITVRTVHVSVNKINFKKCPIPLDLKISLNKL
jgi:YbgC/YbaW family acyl-CoA thioester hydrolase